MSFTYTTLKQALQDYAESDETTYVTNIDFIIKQSEDRILKKIQLPNFKKTATPTLVDGTATATIPSDFLAPYHFTVDNSGIVFLLFKEVSFIRSAYPVLATKGVPKHYAIQDDTTFLLGPTPDSAYTTELYYFYRPTSIVDGATSWLGTNAEATLFSGCLLEGHVFLKHPPDTLKVLHERYADALKEDKLLGEGRMSTDSYRSA